LGIIHDDLPDDIDFGPQGDLWGDSSFACDAVNDGHERFGIGLAEVGILSICSRTQKKRYRLMGQVEKTGDSSVIPSRLPASMEIRMYAGGTMGGTATWFRIARI
jgi:hypothetical protein